MHYDVNSPMASRPKVDTEPENEEEENEERQLMVSASMQNEICSWYVVFRFDVFLPLKSEGRKKLVFGLKMHDARSPVASRITVDTGPKIEEDENDEK